MIARWRADPVLRKRVGVVTVAIAATVWLPASQCLLLNAMNPWWTQTMVGASWDHWRETGTIAAPVYHPVPIRTLPAHVGRAAVISEDQRFYAHHGFDTEAIAEAWEAYRAHEPGQPLRGGSTISQQVARNVFLWQGRTWVRKGIEAWYTVWLELLVPKDRILELYLNVAEMGPQTFGVEAAARRWYGKPAAELSAAEAAAIISLLPLPTRRTPASPVVQRHARWILAQSVK